MNLLSKVEKILYLAAVGVALKTNGVFVHFT